MVSFPGEEEGLGPRMVRSLSLIDWCWGDNKVPISTQWSVGSHHNFTVITIDEGTCPPTTVFSCFSGQGHEEAAVTDAALRGPAVNSAGLVPIPYEYQEQL